MLPPQNDVLGRIKTGQYNNEQRRHEVTTGVLTNLHNLFFFAVWVSRVAPGHRGKEKSNVQASGRPSNSRDCYHRAAVPHSLILKIGVSGKGLTTFAGRGGLLASRLFVLEPTEDAAPMRCNYITKGGAPRPQRQP